MVLKTELEPEEPAVFELTAAAPPPPTVTV